MALRAGLALLLLLLSTVAGADVPLFGRPQSGTFESAEVYAAGDRQYARLMQQQRAAGLLDQDDTVATRARNLLTVLVAHVGSVAPGMPSIQWEVHVTGAFDIDGVSMGAGKLLIGGAFVERFELSDGELAMVLAHEMAHVLANHVAETYSEAYAVAYTMLPRKPVATVEAVRGTLEHDYMLRRKLGPLSRMQELEADGLGFALAVRAGFSASELLRFFEKLASKPSLEASGETTHPDPATRLNHARAIKVLVESGLL